MNEPEVTRDDFRGYCPYAPTALCIRECPVLSSANTSAYELFLLPSLLGFANKKVTKKWTNFPRVRGALSDVAYALTSAAIASGDPTPTAEFLIVGRRPKAS